MKQPRFALEQDGSLVIRGAVVLSPNGVEVTREDIAFLVAAQRALADISALSNNPHWTSERHWRIAEIANKFV